MQYFKIGKLAASTGLNGELVLQHSLGKKTTLKGLSTIFIADKKDSFLPYFIESLKTRKINEIVIKLESIDNMETARMLTPKEVWLSSDDFKKYASQNTPLGLLGYNLISGDGENLGEIVEVVEQPHQLLCSIVYKKTEAYIPIHEKNILKTDHKAKQIHVLIPDGLLEIYA